MKLKVPTTPHTIRFPGDLYNKLHILADLSGRTFNGTVVRVAELGYAVLQRYEQGIKEAVEASDGQEEVSD